MLSKYDKEKLENDCYESGRNAACRDWREGVPGYRRDRFMYRITREAYDLTTDILRDMHAARN